MRRCLRLHDASAASSTHSTEGGRTIDRFHIRGTAKRRGGILPARLRFSAHRGVTLIELMISMLILTLVCVAWLEIIGIQSARKEARRREAVERLAGMMDAFMYDLSLPGSGIFTTKMIKGKLKRIPAAQYYCLNLNPLSVEDAKSAESIPMFENDVSPIGYRLRILDRSELNKFYNGSEYGDNWVNSSGDSDSYWLVGELYNHNGNVEDRQKPFFALPVCLGL